jgi:hypothetical protein
MRQKDGPVDAAVATEPGADIDVLNIEELERQFATTPSDGREAARFMDATLTLTRNAPDDVQDRVVTFWLDDERWDILRYGHTLSRSVSAGHHRLKAHNTLLTTIFEFDARPGEHIRLRCANAVSRGGTLLMLIIGWAALRVRIEREDAQPGDEPSAISDAAVSGPTDPMTSGLL